MLYHEKVDREVLFKILSMDFRDSFLKPEREDEKDFIEDSYVLEVSSPGLGRPLKKEKDYKRNLGKEVEIRTYRMVD